MQAAFRGVDRSNRASHTAYIRKGVDRLIINRLRLEWRYGHPIPATASGLGLVWFWVRSPILASYGSDCYTISQKRIRASAGKLFSFPLSLSIWSWHENPMCNLWRLMLATYSVRICLPKRDNCKIILVLRMSSKKMIFNHLLTVNRLLVSTQQKE